MRRLNRWCLWFGRPYADSLRRCSPWPVTSGVWTLLHLDQWRAGVTVVSVGDPGGCVWVILVQARRPQRHSVGMQGERDGEAPSVAQPTRGRAIGGPLLSQEPEQPAGTTLCQSTRCEQAMKEHPLGQCSAAVPVLVSQKLTSRAGLSLGRPHPNTCYNTADSVLTLNPALAVRPPRNLPASRNPKRSSAYSPMLRHSLS